MPENSLQENRFNTNKHIRMSFYNPRVRQTYELLNVQHKPVKGRVLAEYGVVYRYATDEKGKISLKPLRYIQPFQQNNLDNIHPELAQLLSNFIADVWLAQPMTPMDYLYKLSFFSQPDIEDRILYYSSIFKEFIEHLLYSAMASEQNWRGDKTYEHSLLHKRHAPHPFDTLIDRLKLNDYLMTHLEIVPHKHRCLQRNNELTLWVKLKIK